MSEKRSKEKLSIHEAMENLSTLMEMDPSNPKAIGVVQDIKLIVEDEDLSYRNVVWIAPENYEDLSYVLERTYSSILDYFQEAHQNDEFELDDKKFQKGIQAMMVLVGESADRADWYLSKVLKSKELPSIKKSKIFKALQQYYVDKIQDKISHELEGDEAWSEQWESNEDAALLDLDKRGLKDFETVRKDMEYEFFYMTHEDGKSYFQPDLLRNIKLVCDFDEVLESPFEEDPLLKMRSMLDKDMQISAEQILNSVSPIVHEFFQKKSHAKFMHVIEDLNHSIIALMLAANPRNLIQHTMQKSSIEYFQDFQYFLREALSSEECQKWIAYPPKHSERLAHCVLDLIFSLCKALFLRLGGIKQEMIGFIHQLIRKGEEVKQKKHMHLFDSNALWIRILEDDDSIRHVLRCYPNGPLFKIIDIIRQDTLEKMELSYCPIHQENIPAHMMDLYLGNQPVLVLRMPCPTDQKFIEKAKLLPEFLCFLRIIKSQKKKYLMFNLQDRTTWKEHARASLVEKLQSQAEFGSCFTCVSIPKNTEFYHQSDLYLQIHEANDFKKLLLEQIESAEDCGFFFPKKISHEEICIFAKGAIEKIHQIFFNKEKHLSRKSRLDFIEIFYQFLYLKVLEIVQPNLMSFTCKDALDVSATALAELFAFVRLILSGQLKREEQEFFRYLCYSFSLTVRERSVISERLNRSVSALAHVDKTVKKDYKVVQPLLDLYKTKSWKIEIEKLIRS